ncbi:MAG: metallophosphoesterase [Rikenellaceae bacterium]|nr:metallophosphoesterase [Rikenellaceae bacterium]
MRYVLILFMALLALLVDWYIWRRVVCRRFPRRWFKAAYLASVVLIDLGVVIAMLIYKFGAERQSAGMMVAVMWTICVFFLSTAPKITYAAVSLLDYPVRWITRRRSHIFGYLGTALGLAVFGVMLYGATAGRRTIRVEQVTVCSAKVPPSFDGFRIAFFSDTHIGTLRPHSVLVRRMVETINGLDPDLVVNGGDLVNIQSDDLTPGFADQLSAIRSRHGVVSVLGNHDKGYYIFDTTRLSPRQSIAELAAKQRRLGWTLLVDSAAYIVRSADSIAVSGVDYERWTGDNTGNARRIGAGLDRACAAIPDSVFNLLVSHSPLIWDQAVASGYGDLMLSGHVHAMQMKFRLGRLVWSPAELIYPEWSGLYERGGRRLYINDGIGCVMFPMRIGARPEVTLVTLCHEKQSTR